MIWIAKKAFAKLLIVLGIVGLFTQCGVYSFTGTNLPPEVKTITIKNFADRTGSGPAYLSQFFTDKAREYFQSNSKLALTNSGGDLVIEGTLIGYTLTPVAPTANDRAARTRLTITVQVKYTNTRDEEQDFDQQFSFFSDVDQSQSIASVERGKIDEISNAILLDIFNKTVANW